MLLKASPIPKKKAFASKLCCWKLKDPDVRKAFQEAFSANLESEDQVIDCDVERLWTKLKNALLKTTNDVCGKSKKGVWRNETWWWNEDVENAVSEKRRLWKAWRNGGSKEEYLNAKRASKRAVFIARKIAEDDQFSDIKENDPKLFRLAKQMRKENQDVVGEKCVRDDEGCLSFSDADKKKAWKQHYEKLLNVEFPWSEENLSAVSPVLGPANIISNELVHLAVREMKSNKAPGPSGIVAEMLNAAPESCIQLITDLANSIVQEGKIPSEWNDSYIISLFKGKGDALERGNYRGLKLTEQVLKVIERIFEKIIRGIVDIDDMQFGFVPGRGTTDAIFIVRQLQEKYLAKNKNLYFAFVDLEKAFDRVPRKVLWWAMRVVGIPEWIIAVVQSMYSGAKSQVRVNDSY